MVSCFISCGQLQSCDCDVTNFSLHGFASFSYMAHLRRHMTTILLVSLEKFTSWREKSRTANSVFDRF